MFHLDNNSGVSSMPAPAAMQEQSTRWFTEGAGNQSPSWPGQDWFNIVQAELLNVLTASGITPVKTQYNQLALAIKAIVGNNALLRDNLFSEIKALGAPSQAAARVNLGLGTAAIADVQVSQDDTTTGRLLKTGSAIAVRTLRYNSSNASGTDLNELPGNSVGFVYSGATNSPGITGSVLDFSGVSGGYNVQITANYNGGSILKFRTKNGDKKVWNDWYDIYHSGRKPTATDVDAVSATNGGIFSKSITVTTQLQLLSSTAGHTSYILGRDSAGSNKWFVGRGTVDADTINLWNYVSSTGIIIYANGDVYAKGALTTSDYKYFDARYYTKAQSDAAYMPKVSAYTKTESDARYVQDIDHTAAVEKQFYDGQPYSNTHTTDGAHLANIRFYGGENNSGWFIVRYTRKKINGVWYTLS